MFHRLALQNSVQSKLHESNEKALKNDPTTATANSKQQQQQIASSSSSSSQSSSFAQFANNLAKNILSKIYSGLTVSSSSSSSNDNGTNGGLRAADRQQQESLDYRHLDHSPDGEQQSEIFKISNGITTNVVMELRTGGPGNQMLASSSTSTSSATNGKNGKL